ncbi:MAG: hypothetical protein IJ165_04845, partial [Proteobacteria bacterium]|nr:hypothetical protein [Pseudomonadota bacterium]
MELSQKISILSQICDTIPTGQRLAPNFTQKQKPQTPKQNHSQKPQTLKNNPHKHPNKITAKNQKSQPQTNQQQTKTPHQNIAFLSEGGVGGTAFFGAQRKRLPPHPPPKERQYFGGEFWF